MYHDLSNQIFSCLLGLAAGPSLRLSRFAHFVGEKEGFIAHATRAIKPWEKAALKRLKQPSPSCLCHQLPSWLLCHTRLS
jgi:hypothetical protein